MNELKEVDGYLRVHLCKGVYAKVDIDTDRSIFENHWTYDKTTGYAYRIDRSDGSLKKIYLHRLLACANTGDHVDHQNRDKTDNRLFNLRVGTAHDNARNQGPRGRVSYRGVFEHNGKYEAKIRVNGDYVSLGSFYETPEEAAHEYNKASMKYYPETGVINPVFGIIDQSIPDGNYISVDGIMINVTTVSKALGVVDKTMFTRKHRGWDDEECIAGVRRHRNGFESLLNHNKQKVIDNV